MEIRQLRYAVLLAEQKHFGRAAERAFITQSAFSQQIAILERGLQVRLFDRLPSGIELTAAGEAFINHAYEVLAGITTLEDDIRSIARGHSGLLRVGTFGAGAGEFTPLLMSTFRSSMPDVEIEFHELSMTGQFDELRSGRVDVALLHPLCDDDDVDFTMLFDEPRCAAVANTHRLADAPTVSIGELALESFVTARAGTPASWRNFWAFGDDQHSRKTPRAEMSSISEGLYAVAYLNVVDTVPSTAVRYHRHPGVTFVPLEDASYSSVAIARRKGDTRPAVEAFCELAGRLADEHRSIVPGAVQPGMAPV